MQKRLRAFVDTSALLAGLNSPYGAAGTILAACFSRDVIPVISPQVVEEAERNIPRKFPLLADAWINFLLIPPEMMPMPAAREVKNAYKILPTSDAPILASALKSNPDTLITWNSKDFLRKEVIAAVPFSILTPPEFLQQFL